MFGVAADRKLTAAVENCKTESEQALAKQKPTDSAWKLGRLVCDPAVLRKLETNVEQTETVQLLVMKAANEANDAPRWPYGAAILVLVVGILPYAWYFLLRRIRELRDAIAGK